MAGAPRCKVYDAQGQYEAACKHAEVAAGVVALLGDGATIRDGHRVADIMWTEGAEEMSAGESYDRAAMIVGRRIIESANRLRARHEVERADATRGLRP